MFKAPDKFTFATDIIVFSVLRDELKILLVRRKYPPFKSMYALPGGFIQKSEELEDAARRELFEETGVKDLFLHKLNVYGSVDRDPRGRVISVAYLALIDGDRVALEAKTDAEIADWFSVYNLPKLAFDHNTLIDDALKELRFLLQTTNVAFQIMPDRFTLSELQKTYEVIMGKSLDKRNFRKKLKELDLLRPLAETKMDGPHRPAQLHKFRSKQFQPLAEKMHVFL